MSEDLPDAVLSEIRRAAFELRRSDPDEAVRVLRRIAAEGGAAAVLAHGALAEIYLDEYADLDGAEAEFRAVLEAAPQLPAAELGLARVLREQGRLAEADSGLERALAGFSGAAEALRQGQSRGEPLPAGSEEEVLGLLEVAVELAELRHQRGQNGSVRVPLDDSLLGWAGKQRLFDAVGEEDEDDGSSAGEDWVRFHALWMRLRVLTGRGAEAAAALAEAEELGQLDARAGAQLRSEVLEDTGRLAEAAAEAVRALAAAREEGELPEGDEVLRAAALLAAGGDDAAADAELSRALPELEAAAKEAEGEEREELSEAARKVRAALDEPRGDGPRPLVSLGLRKKP